MNLIFTKEEQWLNKWDDYVYKNPRGSHLAYSDWLKSYQSYGFDFEVGLILENDSIIGGYGAVIPKFLFFKFYIIPHGPIFDSNKETHINFILQEIAERAKYLKASYVQFSLPLSAHKSINNYTYSDEILKKIPKKYTKRKQFKYIYTSYGLNWISTQGFDNEEEFLNNLTSKVRRNIRMPYNKKAEAFFITDPDDIEKGFSVIVESANNSNYAVREYKEFRSTIINLINKNRAYFIVCKVNSEIKAAAFFVLTGNYITNIMGGVLRSKPDIKLGYMLQWEIIKKAFVLKHFGYNISMGGSSGVQDFKSKFSAEQISYDDATYSAILNPIYFKAFKFFDNYMRPYKSKVSSLLSYFKK